ncbi:hypothetical protein H4R21_005932, partial [Coemansia helicoidea]
RSQRQLQRQAGLGRRRLPGRHAAVRGHGLPDLHGRAVEPPVRLRPGHRVQGHWRQRLLRLCV